jgi:hypothetical protein
MAQPSLATPESSFSNGTLDCETSLKRLWPGLGLGLGAYNRENMGKVGN